MTIALALLSAALFGTGVALQQQPASQVPMRFVGRPGLLIRVAQQPVWLARGRRRRSGDSPCRSWPCATARWWWFSRC